MLSSVKQHSEQTKHILPTYRCMNCTQNLISATIGAETVYTRECSDLADPNSYKCDDGQSGITVDLHFCSVIILLMIGTNYAKVKTQEVCVSIDTQTS